VFVTTVFPGFLCALRRHKYKLLGAFSKFPEVKISFVRSFRPCLSVYPYGTTRLPLDEYSGKLIFWDFSKTFLENSNLVIPDKNNRYLHRDLHKSVISYLIFSKIRNILEWICILYSKTKFLFRKSCHLWDNVEKYFRAGQATYGNIIRRRNDARIQTLVISNTDCFSMEAVITRKRLSVILDIPALYSSSFTERKIN
jgi:hypothetical protein